ncbi:unnamed protein product, partial [Ectocarpus sp. 8 AP-2014]
PVPVAGRGLAPRDHDDPGNSLQQQQQQQEEEAYHLFGDLLHPGLVFDDVFGKIQRVAPRPRGFGRRRRRQGETGPWWWWRYCWWRRVVCGTFPHDAGQDAKVAQQEGRQGGCPQQSRVVALRTVRALLLQRWMDGWIERVTIIVIKH